MRPNDFGSPSCAAAQPVAGYRRLHPGQPTDAFVLHHPAAKCVHTRFADADNANLDLIWLRDESLEDAENLPASEIIARETVEDLTAALTESGAVATGLAAAVNAS